MARLKLPSGRQTKNFTAVRRLILFSAAVLILFAPQLSYAHQQPTTIVLLDVSPDKVGMELQVPLSELELAFGHDLSQNTDALIQRSGSDLKQYLLAHIHPTTAENQPWSVEVTDMQLEKAEQTRSGPYQEITFHLNLTPPANADTRKFVLNYDVVMHQVVSHIALVGIRKDWETGKTGEQPVTIGYIKVDTASTKIFPLEINLQKGSLWNGFQGMVRSGARHVKESADYLVFLFAFLLPLALLSNGKKWGGFGGTQYTFKRLLKIVTAFAVGHLLTLGIGASGWFNLPAQSVEVLIAISILVSAAHAVRPIFSGKEVYAAAVFGLIHGLAFAAVLFNLKLQTGAMALSIVGFDVGIELTEIFVIAVTMPWIIVLSLTSYYKWIRVSGACLAATVAVFRLAEHLLETSNTIGGRMINFSEYAHFGVLMLALIAVAAYGLDFVRNKNISVDTQI